MASDKQIAFVVGNKDVDIASVRHRALYPALYLSAAGYEAQVLTRVKDLRSLRSPNVCFVKCFDPRVIRAAASAKAAGQRVMIDLCDNVFHTSYGTSTRQQSPQLAKVLCEIADAIVVPTHELAKRIRPYISHDRFHVSPDAIEDQALYDRGMANWPVKAPLLQVFLNVIRGRTPLGKGVPKRSATRRVIWFGNSRGATGNTGLQAILPVVPALIAIGKQIDIDLLIVSNDQGEYHRLFDDLPLKAHYLPWSFETLQQALKTADVCIVPNAMDEFNSGKSPNRAVLALAAGVPVVASRTPALLPFENGILFDDWYAGLQRYLGADGPSHASSDLAIGLRVARDECGEQKIVESWKEILASTRTKRNPARVPLKLGVVFALDQDCDLLIPVLNQMNRETGWNPVVIVSKKLLLTSPRIVTRLSQLGLFPWVFDPTDLSAGRPLEKVQLDALLSGSESSLGPHKTVHSLVKIAGEQNVPTFTMQHGFENVGLTYFDAIHGADVRFASDRIFTWLPESRLAPVCPVETRNKCVHIGYPKDRSVVTNARPTLPDGKPIITIFENLHWHRYDEMFRNAFIEMISTLSKIFPAVLFVVKPHHAGKWLTKASEVAKSFPDNVIIVDPSSSEWEPFTAPDFFAQSTAIISTPSTVLIDAAVVGRRAAVFAHDLSLPLYNGFEKIESIDQAVDFVRMALESPGDSEPHNIVPEGLVTEHPVSHMLEYIRDYCRRIHHVEYEACK